MITTIWNTHSAFHSATDFLPCAPLFITRHSSLTVPLAKIQVRTQLMKNLTQNQLHIKK